MAQSRVKVMTMAVGMIIQALQSTVGTSAAATMGRVTLTAKASAIMKTMILMIMMMVVIFALETKNFLSLATTRDPAAAIAILAV
jgi:hypothetical protein